MTATGCPDPARTLITSYEATQGGHADRAFWERALDQGYRELHFDRWPTDHDQPDPGHVLLDAGLGGAAAVYELDGAVALVVLEDGEARIRVAANLREHADEAIARFRTAYPALSWQDDSAVPVTFWSLGRFGPEPHTRLIDVASWDDVSENYGAEVQAELERLATDFDPGAGGQMLLWQGPPGTGKTWALRALAHEWRGWADFHYITDPDSFFGDNANYMIEVLLHAPHGAEERWRVLILEDAGELLAADARERSGQGLSRLLNVVDGLIGQGLRVLALLTTNDELGDLHPAVQRPGRCASKIVFGPLSAEEATAWLGQDSDAATVAELYARLEQAQEADDPVPAIQQVAEDHRPDGGYGETWWSPATATVFWNAADWTSDDEVEAAAEAFLEIDGVDNFDSDAEVEQPDGADDWEQVWPDPDQAASVAALEAEALRLARQPL